MRCEGCEEQFYAKKLKGGYCENCIESLNLKVCKECKEAFPTMAIKDGYCYSCAESRKNKEKTKHSIKGIVLLLIALGVIGAIAYTFAYLL